MKSINKILTPKQKEVFKNWYLWEDDGLTKLVDIDYEQPTAENFKVLYSTDDKCKVATIEDISYYDTVRKDFEFSIGDEGDYFIRRKTPEEVVEFLDNYLRISQYVE